MKNEILELKARAFELLQEAQKHREAINGIQQQVNQITEKLNKLKEEVKK